MIIAHHPPKKKKAPNIIGQFNIRLSMLYANKNWLIVTVQFENGIHN